MALTARLLSKLSLASSVATFGCFIKFAEGLTTLASVASLFNKTVSVAALTMAF